MSPRTSRARSIEALPQLVYEPLVRAALAEDFGLGGDITSEATVPAGCPLAEVTLTVAPGRPASWRW